MAADEELEPLRRTAFGRTHNPAEEAAAAEAQRLLGELTYRRLEEAAALERTVAGISAEADPASTPAESEVDEFPRSPSLATRRRDTFRMIWLIPIVAASLLIGHASAGLTERGPATMPEPSRTVPSPTGAPAIASTIGDPAGAEQWLERPQIESDQFDAATLLPDLDIDPTSSRFVQVSANNSKLWVARDSEGGFCVLGLRPANGGAFGTCVTRADFARNGLSLRNGYDIVQWDGILFTTSTYAG